MLWRELSEASEESAVILLQVDVPLKKKEKKKKKTKEQSDGVVPIGNDNDDVTEKTTKKDKKKKSKEENGATDSKDSKKRKRSASDENSNEGVEVVGTEESKRRKTDGLEDSKAEQNGEVSVGNHQDELNNSAKQKSSRKELNGSTEVCMRLFSAITFLTLDCQYAQVLTSEVRNFLSIVNVIVQLLNCGRVLKGL